MNRMTHLFRYILMLVFCLAIQGLMAQDNPSAPDKVFLKDGTVVEGWIINYRTGEQLKLRINENQWVIFQPDEIERVVSNVLIEETVSPDRIRKIPFTTRKDLDIVYLKNGEAYGGRILEYEKGKFLNLQTNKGEEMVFDDFEIDRIIYGQRRQDRFRMQPRTSINHIYAFREKGWFHFTNLSFSFGASTAGFGDDAPVFIDNPTNSRLEAGYGFQHVSGYQWSRYLSLGLSLSYDSYNLDRNERVLGIAAHTRAYLMQKRFSPLVSLDAGYGFALKSKRSEIIDAEGGIMFHPAIGLRMGANKGMNMTIDWGLRIQKASYTRELMALSTTEIRDVTFRRWLLRLGLVF